MRTHLGHKLTIPTREGPFCVFVSSFLAYFRFPT